jgi:hypothetical protein
MKAETQTVRLDPQIWEQEVNRLRDAIRLGSSFLQLKIIDPEGLRLRVHPTPSEIENYRRAGKRALAVIYGSEGLQVRRFRQEASHAFRKVLVHVPSGYEEDPLYTVELADSDAFKNTLDLLEVAYLFAGGKPTGSQDNASESAGRTETKRSRPRRGPAPKKENWTIWEEVSKYGEGWRQEDNLVLICGVLDNKNVPIPTVWARWDRKPHSWIRAADHDKGKVIKVIEGRIKSPKKSSLTA